MSAFKVKATSGGGQTEIPDAGAHPAVLVGLIDLGTHTEDFKGQVKQLHKILLAWELPGEKMSGTTGRSHVVGRDYNLTFAKKASLRGMVEKWRGKEFGDDEEFDVSKLLGKPCLITLVHKTSSNDNTYAKIEGVGPLPKGMPIPKATITPVAWSLGDGAFPNPNWLPYLYGESVETVIGRCHELAGTGATRNGTAVHSNDATEGSEPAGDANEDCPF